MLMGESSEHTSLTGSVTLALIELTVVVVFIIVIFGELLTQELSLVNVTCFD